MLCNSSIRGAFNSGTGHISGAGVFHGVSLLRLMLEVAHQHWWNVQLSEGMCMASLLQDVSHHQPRLRHQGFGMSCGKKRKEKQDHHYRPSGHTTLLESLCGVSKRRIDAPSIFAGVGHAHSWPQGIFMGVGYKERNFDLY